MIVRFGYVAMSVYLKNASPSQTMTIKQFEQIKDREAAIRKLERIAKANIENCSRLVKHSLAHDITFFRLSSKLVPLVNHPHTEGWRYDRAIDDALKELGLLIKQHDMRVDFHPDHFVVLNNLDEDLLKRSLQTLLYHYKLLTAMGVDERNRCVLHVGGAKNGKVSGLEDFIENYQKIPTPLQRMIMLENDDTVFHIDDVLFLGEKVQLPVVFDLHHHDLNQPDSFSFADIWQRVVNTWVNSPLPMKMHISSPKEGEKDKRHHDYIDVDRFLNFLNEIKGSVDHLDVMIEAKKKDDALFQLMKKLQARTECSVINQATIEI